MMLKTKKEIQAWLKSMDIENYKIRQDLKVNVDGSVNLSYRNLNEIPVQFHEVTGNFRCDGNNLVSLKGSPKIVKNTFSCGANELTSTKYSPEIVGENCLYGRNKIKSLEGVPKNTIFLGLSENEITSLEGLSVEQVHEIDLMSNPIINFNHKIKNLTSFLYSNVEDTKYDMFRNENGIIVVKLPDLNEFLANENLAKRLDKELPKKSTNKKIKI